MKPLTFALSFLLAASGLPAWAGPGSLSAAAQLAPAQVAVKGQEVAGGDDARREEAVVARRLSALELAELRQQVRQQWATAAEAGRSAELPSVERITPGAATKGEGLPAPRTARP
jgi:hypothetical protein